MKCHRGTRPNLVLPSFQSCSNLISLLLWSRQSGSARTHEDHDGVVAKSSFALFGQAHFLAPLIRIRHVFYFFARVWRYVCREAQVTDLTRIRHGDLCLSAHMAPLPVQKKTVQQPKGLCPKIRKVFSHLKPSQKASVRKWLMVACLARTSAASLAWKLDICASTR